MTESINAKDLLDPVDLHTFMQDLLDRYGDTEQELMILLLKITTAKAILEDALGLDSPLLATLEDEDADQNS